MKNIVYVLLIVFAAACTEKKGVALFNEQVEKELARHKKVDSLFFEIHFGMTQHEFYTYCWEMNKKGILTDGSDGKGNMFILYKPKDLLRHPSSMNFFPIFKDSVITGMNVLFQYDGWAPWNKQLFADSLLPDVLTMYKKWYASGNQFIEINDEKKGLVYAKIDGNRRIVISKIDDSQVKAVFTDMLHAEPVKENNAKPNF